MTIVISGREFIIRDRTRSKEVVEGAVSRGAKLRNVGVEKREYVERFNRGRLDWREGEGRGHGGHGRGR